MKRKKKIFIIGSLTRETFIKVLADKLSLTGEFDVKYVRKQPNKSFDVLVNEAFQNILDADEIIAVKKADGTLGRGTVYEMKFAEFNKKPVRIFEEKQ